jgi:toxin CcdB
VTVLRQFDVVPNPFARSRDRQPYLVALQSDVLARNLSTVVVAPLERAGSAVFADRLNPHVVVNGEPFALMVQELVSVRTAALGSAHDSVVAERDNIIAALDLLFTGF